MNTNTNISEEELDLIERYILNNMSSNEHAALTARLSNEPDLHLKVAEVKLLLTGVNEAILHDKLNGFHNELPAKAKSRALAKVSSLNRWLMAAAAIMIVCVGLWLLVGPFSTEEKIFTEYYKPDPGLISAMSTSDNYLFDRAMIDYKTGNYDSAIKTWESMLALNPANDTLNYFIGSAWLGKEKSDKAIPYFKKVIAVPASYFLKDAYWYLGLALVKEDRIEQAIPFIKKADHEGKDAVLKKLKE